jgi:hypothetical protein
MLVACMIVQRVMHILYHPPPDGTVHVSLNVRLCRRTGQRFTFTDIDFELTRHSRRTAPGDSSMTFQDSASRPLKVDELLLWLNVIYLPILRRFRTTETNHAESLPQ